MLSEIDIKRIKVDNDISKMWDAFLNIMFSEDIQKSRNGNKAAALRIRNRCREIGELSSQLRRDFFEP